MKRFHCCFKAHAFRRMGAPISGNAWI
jgi:hypothetical protein